MEVKNNMGEETQVTETPKKRGRPLGWRKVKPVEKPVENGTQGNNQAS
jgi:hypothetical protein